MNQHPWVIYQSRIPLGDHNYMITMVTMLISVISHLSLDDSSMTNMVIITTEVILQVFFSEIICMGYTHHIINKKSLFL